MEKAVGTKKHQRLFGDIPCRHSYSGLQLDSFSIRRNAVDRNRSGIQTIKRTWVFIDPAVITHWRDTTVCKDYPSTKNNGAALSPQEDETIDCALRAIYIRHMPTSFPNLVDALSTLGDLLQDRGQDFDLVIIGGGALLLLDLIDRPTKDLDVVARIQGDLWLRARPFPPELARAVGEVAGALDLADDWLNPGPTDLLDLGLPDGFADRVHVRKYGGLTVRFAGREDQIAFKLYAAADHWPDQSRHLADLRRLSPTAEELLDAARWCRTHDPSEGFRDVLLLPILAELGMEGPDV